MQIYTLRPGACRSGEIGRRAGFKIPFWQQSDGSSPSSGTIIPMKNIHLMSFNRILIMLFAFYAAVGFSTNISAWGEDGHAAVGILSLERLQADAGIELQRILGSLDEQTLVEVCNWPDTVKKTEEWAWSYPLHFVNIPKGASSYSKSRDCPDQLCATEAIKRYAAELGDRKASMEKRRQAFAWICHLTGDLHQPLHAGYSGAAYDKGGNNFAITFAGEQTNLHYFWDSALIESRTSGLQQLIGVLGRFPVIQAGDDWSAGMADRWTDESHQLVQQEIYPQDPVITQSYADKSWEIMQQRVTTAASHLALIVNTVL